MQVLFVYVSMSFTADLILLNHKSAEYPTLTLITLSLFTIIEYSLFALFLFIVIKSKYFKSIITTASVLFLLFATWFIFDIGAQKKFDSLPASIEAILIIVFSILFLFDQMNNPEVIMIYESHRFWVITAFLIYMAGGLFLWIYADSFTKEQKNYYWNINHTINIVKNILISFAFVMKKTKSNIHPSLQKSYNI